MTPTPATPTTQDPSHPPDTPEQANPNISTSLTTFGLAGAALAHPFWCEAQEFIITAMQEVSDRALEEKTHGAGTAYRPPASRGFIRKQAQGGIVHEEADKHSGPAK